MHDLIPLCFQPASFISISYQAPIFDIPLGYLITIPCHIRVSLKSLLSFSIENASIYNVS